MNKQAKTAFLLTIRSLDIQSSDNNSNFNSNAGSISNSDNEDGMEDSCAYKVTAEREVDTDLLQIGDYVKVNDCCLLAYMIMLRL